MRHANDLPPAISRHHVIADLRMRLDEGGGFVRCSCSVVLERLVSTLCGEDPFQPLHDAFVDHRRQQNAGDARPVRNRSAA